MNITKGNLVVECSLSGCEEKVVYDMFSLSEPIAYEL
jgi:hypothetical protein